MPIESPRQLRVLIDGHEDWQMPRSKIVEEPIPDDCTKIVISGQTLLLRGLWSDKDLELFDPKDVVDGTEIKLDDKDIFPEISKPNIIFTQDGRIYQRICDSREWLDAFVHLAISRNKKLQEALFSSANR